MGCARRERFATKMAVRAPHPLCFLRCFSPPVLRAGPVTVVAVDSLSALLGPRGRVALPDSARHPAGVYVRQALRSMRIWNKVEPRRLRAPDAEAALAAVATDDAALRKNVFLSGRAGDAEG